MRPTTKHLSTNADLKINGLIEALRRFNAKERFFLVNHFLGKFTPDHMILEKLENDLSLPKGIFVKAPDPFCAMDYHLDWLNGALELAFLHKFGKY